MNVLRRSQRPTSRCTCGNEARSLPNRSPAAVPLHPRARSGPVQLGRHKCPHPTLHKCSRDIPRRIERLSQQTARGWVGYVGFCWIQGRERANRCRVSLVCADSHDPPKLHVVPALKGLDRRQTLQHVLHHRATSELQSCTQHHENDAKKLFEVSSGRAEQPHRRASHMSY